MGILEDLKAYLTYTGASFGDIYFNHTEPVKENCVCLWQYDGIYVAQGLRPQVQVMVKNYSMQQAENQIYEIYDRIKGNRTYQKTVEVNGKTMLITPKQSPFYLNKDESGRHIYVFNIDIITKRS